MVFDIGIVSNKKILLVDDEEDIVNLLETVLRKEGFKNIIKAKNGIESIELCKREKPDLIVLDIMLPDIDGFLVCQEIRKFSTSPILFLSAKDEETDKILGLGIGGDDYVTKPFSPKEVAYRIKAYFRRHQIGSGKQTSYSIGNLSINEETGEVYKNRNHVILTAKEFQLLLMFCKNPNRILSKNLLYEAIWKEDYLSNENTVMVHIRHLREKIEDTPSKPKFIRTVRGLGYKLVTQENI
ncbi:DNA-binding response regulator [Virgibacillus dokdonensis]|uniref:DNA-binding response regulator n=1 Tax=Virgibacillus dokdonensis TaxID=302167 RepID=A0A3E0WLF6_9BACI|nr:response regulator transcription factor [Virgibacillus dokdonensis]RFA32765.1 DNA-binding response regulator [Virgibacillus dokdonensis]